MKNKYWLLIIAALIIRVLPSCKKKIQNCKLGKYYLSDGSSTPAPNTFSYYDNGKVKRIEYTNGAKDTIAYNTDTITILSYDGTGLLVNDFTGITNANGSVTSAIKKTHDINGNITGTDYLTYDYNTYNELIKKTTVNNSGTTFLDLNYTGANVVSGTLHVASILTKKYFFYHNTVENKTQVDDFNGVFAPWLGSPSIDLLDSMHIIAPATADTTRIQYTHTLDANGYLSKTIQTQVAPVVSSKYHTYQYFDCN